jgi:peptide deformylase
VCDVVDLCAQELRGLAGFWKGKGMSIAATQVGRADIPLFVMCHRQNWYTPRMYRTFQTFINPKILEYSEEQCLAWEGCISNDDELCLVERPLQVRVSFNNLKGEEFDMLCTGLMGRIFQHELDHLNGELMWEDVKVSNVPRRLEKQIKISEVERSPEDFYSENEKLIFEF